MKHILLSISTAFLCITQVMAQAPSEQYMTLMKTNITQLFAAEKVEDIKTLQNTFERIGKKETKEWLPNYYAALSILRQTWFSQDLKGDAVDAMMDKADDLVKEAEAVSGDKNPELLLMKSMITSGRIGVNPMVRGRELGGKSAALVKEAAALDPGNPRVTLLNAQSYYFTPELFGGDKKKAKELFLKTIEQTKEYKPKSDIHPTWGAENAAYFLSLYKDK